MHFPLFVIPTFSQRCLEKLIQKYGTGLETIVAKEKEFERLIEVGSDS